MSRAERPRRIRSEALRRFARSRPSEWELEDKRRRVEELVREHPLRAALIAASAGFLIGRVLR